MKKNTGIAVLEAQWWKGRHTSVRGLFDLISDLSFDGREDRYHYETISSEVAARDAIARMGAMRGIHYLYIACHGSERGLHLSESDMLSRTELANDLASIANTNQSRLFGVHLGACSFGIEETAQLAIAKGDLVWLAGYDTEVDWLKSSALDMLFFNELIDLDFDRHSQFTAIKYVADMIRQAAPGLVNELGFHIWIKKRGGGVIDLMALD
jgi:hypothetical protein